MYASSDLAVRMFSSKENAAETVSYLFPATRCKLNQIYPSLLFNFLLSSAMLRLTWTTHKNSKVSKCLQCGQTEWQPSCRTQSRRFIAQKGSIRFTKLPLPCNSVHANSYTKTKLKKFCFHCYIISCCTELHETCTKHKRRKLPTFLACPLFASSDRNADLG